MKCTLINKLKLGEKMENKTKLGTCIIKDMNGFLRWLEETGYRRTSKYSMSPIYNGGWYNDNWQSYFYNKQDIFREQDITNIFDDCVNDTNKRRTGELLDLMAYLESANQQMEVYYTDEMASLIGFGKQRYIIPTKWLDITFLKDYSHLTVSELKALGGPMQEGTRTELAVMENVSMDSLKDKKLQQENNIKNLNQQMEDVKNAKTEELAKLQEEINARVAELEKKKRDMLATLQEKMDELAEKKAEMEKQIYMLETQIYGIRCYLGEVVNFTQVTSGRPAPDDEPVILYQKIRFLDEEMGKALALYDFDGNDTNLLLNVLRTREDIRELLAPGNKSISFIRISATGTQVGMHDKIRNMLKKYEAYHGKQLAVFLKNGENLHIAWLDEEKINIGDGNVFMAPSERIDDIDSDFPRESTQEEMISRYFIFSLLQGIKDNSNLIHIENDKIVFSYADGWIDDKKYGNFCDIIDRISQLPMRKGDMVLTTMHITRDDSYKTRDDKYNNDRGIGEKNRTHDASLGSLKVYPMNKVLRDVIYEVKYRDHKAVIESEKVPCEDGHGYYIRTKSKVITDEIIREGTASIICSEEEREWYEKRYGLSFSDPEGSAAAVLSNYDRLYGYASKRTDYDTATEQHYCREYYDITYKETENHYFLSAIKSDSRWNESGKLSRANMEVFGSEVIPLTFLNSTWVKYAITTKHIGKWRIGGTTLNYAESLLYLNHILEYVTEREKKEKECLVNAGLEKWLNENTYWPVTLSEWKMEHDVRTITEYQAKRFAKSM